MAELTLAERLRERFPALRVEADVPLREHCSFRIGGPADAFAEAEEEQELAELLAFVRAEGIPLLLLGNGTNLLIRDEGFRGLALRLGGAFARVERQGTELVAGAGIPLARLAVFARQEGLAGLAFAHGIPGTLGGAVVMNAGAYGGEMKDVVVSVRALGSDGVVREHFGADNAFGYRSSRYEHSGEIVLSVRMALQPGDGEAIGEEMRQLQSRRAASQPLDRPSAGSTFKRPAVGYAAAMIDEAGLKGYAVGGAQVSEKHAGFVINRGEASCADVLALMAHVQRTVEQRFGVTLEPEVRIIGG